MRNILFCKRIYDDSFFDDGFFSKGELTENYNDDLDQQIHSYILNNDLEEINSFILPISINGNFFDFSGLIFAHHVRLTKSIKCCNSTIVLYGTLEVEQLLRLTPLARILLTDNVLYVNISLFSFDSIKNSIKKYTPKPFSLFNFLKHVQINPPANYDSHHSVDNEFALIQWSKYINCYDKLPNDYSGANGSTILAKWLHLKTKRWIRVLAIN